jgi:hypothetical protein
MTFNFDTLFELPFASSEIVTAREAVEYYLEMLEQEGLPPFPYDPGSDEVLVRYRSSDWAGDRFYGFAPVRTGVNAGTTILIYDWDDIPLNVWQVKVNYEVVYQGSGVDDGADEVGAEDEGPGAEAEGTA